MGVLLRIAVDAREFILIFPKIVKSSKTGTAPRLGKPEAISPMGRFLRHERALKHGLPDFAGEAFWPPRL
jgi:hypothetical protein